MIRSSLRLLAALCAAALLAVPGEATTTERLFKTPFGSTGDETGSPLAAQALFELSGSSLKVTLTNTSMEDVLHNPDVLTGVFFDVCGDPTLTKKSAKLAGGSKVINDSYPPGGNVGGEWAYRGNLSHPAVGRYGISAVGFGSDTQPDMFSKYDRFDTGQNHQGQKGLQGLNYGITSKGDNMEGTGPITGTGLVGAGGTPLIQYSALFCFDVNPYYFDLDDIYNVEFQYGTDLCETRLPGCPTPVPEPASMTLLGLGAAGMAWRRRRARRVTTEE